MRLASEASHLSKNLGPARRPHRRFVHVGQTVLHYPNSDTAAKPSLALVDAVGEMALDLLVFREGSESWSVVSGVRHVDLDKSEAVRLESGGWDFTEGDVRLYNARPELGQWYEDTEAGKKAVAEEEARRKQQDAERKAEKITA